VGEPFRDPGRPAGPAALAQLVAAVGHGRTGALAVLQRGVVPEPVTDPIPLHGAAISPLGPVAEGLQDLEAEKQLLLPWPLIM